MKCHCGASFVAIAAVPQQYQWKTQQMIESLVIAGNVDKLKAMSQHCTPDAWHEV